MCETDVVALQFRVVEVRGRKGCLFGIEEKERRETDIGQRSNVSLDAISYVELT